MLFFINKRKEVIRCLMVQVRGRTNPFGSKQAEYSYTATSADNLAYFRLTGDVKAKLPAAGNLTADPCYIRAAGLIIGGPFHLSRGYLDRLYIIQESATYYGQGDYGFLENPHGVQEPDGPCLYADFLHWAFCHTQ